MPETDTTPVDQPRCVSGIEGLDDILAGGLPSNCFYLVQGDPGSGKTTLALQFLLEGVRRGEKVFYITLSETRAELLQVADSHGWSLDDVPLLELSAIEALLRPEAQTTVFHPSEIELTKITNLVLDETRRIQPTRVVFDSLSEFRLIAETALRYRRHLLNLKQEFAKQGGTVLLLDDKMSASGAGHDPHVLSLTHGVIEMEQLSPDYGRSRRRLRVSKMRGVQFREGYHDYTIETGGLRIFPRLVAAEHHLDFRREPVSSGVPELDELLGGGLDRGTTTLLIGPAGSGKSSVAMQYVAEMGKHGERSTVFAFDETLGIMTARAEALGLPLRAQIKSGVVTARQIDPAEISPGEFAWTVAQSVEAGCKLVVIDSLNGYLNAMPGEKYLNNQLHELTSYLNQQGVVTILIMAQHGMVTALEAPVDLSYLCDTVINMRYFETAGEVKKSMAVIKKRSGHHERSIREFTMDSGKGLRIGLPLRGFQGILTGAPKFDGNSDAIMRSYEQDK
ncbi:MAG TPA: ATPase domain-containing protein [Pyrinomonadaceae bacterium]|nr:ATPase domain-containing protein [Pyrinomonadaceae bacterium]